ncbi:MAG: hypothetical protein U0599_20365, partial [Vicinamibacteria bacterium]
MIRRPRAFAVLLVLAVLTLAGARPAAAGASAAVAAPRALTPAEQAWVAHAQRVDRDGWIHLRIAGGPRERGFQHGYLLAKEIDASLRTTRRRWEYKTGMEWPWLVRKSEAMFRGRVDAEILAELAGLAAGLAAAGVP